MRGANDSHARDGGTAMAVDHWRRTTSSVRGPNSLIDHVFHTLLTTGRRAGIDFSRRHSRRKVIHRGVSGQDGAAELACPAAIALGPHLLERGALVHICG